MKAEIATVEPVNPPKVLTLELSELEARALYWAINPSEARDYWQEIGADSADTAADLACEIEGVVEDAFEAEGLKIDLN